jgi:hypothetical protein
VTDENDDLADSQILNRWKNCLSQVLNAHNVIDVRQIEIHTGKPLVPGPSPLEVEIVIAKLEKYKSPDSYQILAELIEAGGERVLSAILSKMVQTKEMLYQHCFSTLL